MGCREGLPLPGIILIAPPGRGHLKQVTSCARADKRQPIGARIITMVFDMQSLTKLSATLTMLFNNSSRHLLAQRGTMMKIRSETRTSKVARNRRRKMHQR